MLQKFGPPETWLIPAAEIEAIMTTQTCAHDLGPIDACRECLIPALVRRQMAILAERLGCAPEEAAAVGERLVPRHTEGRRS